MRACVLRITGRVQGVGFRWFTERAATSLGVVGKVRNVPDGSVEVFAQADEASLDAFCQKLAEGPRGAIVSGVEHMAAPVDAALGAFRVTY